METIRGRPMLPPRQYDIFEVLPNGLRVQRGFVTGIEAAWQELDKLAKDTTNECLAIYLPAREVVAQLNVPLSEERASKRVFQIAYTEELGMARAATLTRRGYRVITVLGNERAKVVLASVNHYDLFIIGHGAPEGTRNAMVAWLNGTYPGVKILALNSVFQRLPDADYNVMVDGPERWIPIVAKATQ